MEILRQTLPDLGRRRLSRAALVRILAWTSVALAVAAALYGLYPHLVDFVVARVPVQWEERIGGKVIGQLVRHMDPAGKGRFCSGQGGTAALERLTARLAAAAGTPYRFHVRVADVKMVNAFAAPGGHIVIMRELIDQARSPDEVAGVLAHEMSHVIKRHATEAILRQMGIGVIMDAFFRDPSSLGPGLGTLGTLFLGLTHSRKAEAEADALALKILRSADIRADGLVVFLQRLAEKEQKGLPLPAILSSHPRTETRVIEANAGKGGQGPGMPAGDWVLLRSICKTTTPAEPI